jgi:hypothetical protein
VKKGENHINEKLNKLAAYLLALLFIAIPMLPLLHSHGQTTDIVTSTEGETPVVKITGRCKLCHFLAHKQIKDYQLEDAFEVVVPILLHITANTTLVAINYSFTLNGFTNKGPPATFC